MIMPTNISNESLNESRFMINSHRFFLIISVIIGFLLTFLTPPMAVPDENAHFINSYAVSKGDLFANAKDGQVGVSLPSSIIDFVNTSMAQFNNGDLDNSTYTFSQYYFNSWDTKGMSDAVFYPSEIRIANPVGYLVSGLGMALGDLLSKPIQTPYNLMLYGRIFNLIFYIAVTYQAIKMTPYFKKTMLVLALMPMSIFLAASLSYDAILIPVCFLLFALIAKLVNSPKEYIVSKKDICIIAFSAFFLAGIKFAYFLLLIVLFAVPRYHFGSLKRYIACIAMAAVIGAVAYGVPTLCNNAAAHNVVLNSSAYSAAQQDYLSKNIFVLPSLILNSFKTFDVFYLNGFFGILGNLDTNFPLPIQRLFYIALAVIVLAEAFEVRDWAWKMKLFSIISILVILIGIYTIMYIGWTSQVVGIGANYVSGIQGRYFIPLALFGCILLTNPLLQRVQFKKQKQVGSALKVISLFVPVLCGVLTVMTVVIRYWC